MNTPQIYPSQRLPIIVKNVLKTYRKNHKLFVFNEPKQYNLDSPTQAGKQQITLNNSKDAVLRRMLSHMTSVERTKTKISDIITMNDFNLYGTLTFNGNPEMTAKYGYHVTNRNDDALVRQKLSKWLENGQRTQKFEYLIIPERHSDGALHFHGFFRDLPESWLKPSGRVDKKGRKIYNITAYRYGHTNFSYIENLEATSKYIKKYLNKDLGESEKGKKRYWHSKSLKIPLKTYNVDEESYTNQAGVTSWIGHDSLTKRPIYHGYDIPQQALFSIKQERPNTTTETEPSK